jgi:5-methyltetrahydropteroyltriglutamate--homocysteine methyltransferase
LPELEKVNAEAISIEAAQPNLDLSILRELPSRKIMLGVIDLGDSKVETKETVAARIRRALDVLPPERLIIAPDCGMKYLARDVAFGKLKAMVEGTKIVRQELGR